MQSDDLAQTQRRFAIIELGIMFTVFYQQWYRSARVSIGDFGNM